MLLREIGSIVTVLMVASVLAPLGMAGAIAAGRLEAVQGIWLCLGLALTLFLSTRSFMIIWDESPWTRHKQRPFLVGASLPGSTGYSLLALLAGISLRSM